MLHLNKLSLGIVTVMPSLHKPLASSPGSFGMCIGTVPSSGNFTNPRVGHASDSRGTREGHAGYARGTHRYRVRARDTRGTRV